MNHICIIAEAGVNHNGSFDTAVRMIDAAKAAGVDYIKFQTFKPEKLVSRFAEKANYQITNTGNTDSQVDMLRQLSLSYNDFRELKNYCDNIGIGFISTPFDLDSIDFLESLDMDFWKIPSGEITNLPYLEKIAKTGRDIVMSTGMSEIKDIKEAVNVLETNGSGKITLLHCNTQYPTPFQDVNLKAMLHIQNATGKQVGYSDHTKGIEVPIASAALGARVIEKHFTLDRNMEGPDHKASLEPDELEEMVRSVRNIEMALGDGIKRITESEAENIKAARKSIVAARDIHIGEILTENNLTIKRPGNGISPMNWYQVLGTKAVRSFLEDEIIEI